MTSKLLSLSRRWLVASFAVNVVLAAVVCVLLSPGVLVNYDAPFFRLVRPPQLHKLLQPEMIKQALLFALVLGAVNMGLVQGLLRAVGF